MASSLAIARRDRKRWLGSCLRRAAERELEEGGEAALRGRARAEVVVVVG